MSPLDWISYLWNYVPWWVLWIVPAVVLIFTMPYWVPVWNFLPKSVKIALGAVASFIVAIQWGRNKGAQDERKRREEATANARAKKQEIENEVEKLPDSDVDKRLRDNGWMRD